MLNYYPLITFELFLIVCKMSKQLETFKSNLEEFASKHKQEIRKNSQFRVQFQEMCATIGVDPLACENSFKYISVE